MKTKNLFLFIFIFGLFLILPNCTEILDHNDQMPAIENQDDLLIKGKTTLTEADIEGLCFMREEEKLAHDVYYNLFLKWGHPIFENIAASEQTHTTAILDLLIYYKIKDSASSEVGVFNNPDLQALYDELMEKGEQSLTEALNVGVIIEEKDIIDIEILINATQVEKIKRVYQNLLDGSASHLAAFEKVLAI